MSKRKTGRMAQHVRVGKPYAAMSSLTRWATLVPTPGRTGNANTVCEQRPHRRFPVRAHRWPVNVSVSSRCL